MADTAVMVLTVYAVRTAGSTRISGRHMEKWQVVGERGEYIASARQKQSVKNFRMLFYIGSIRKNDCAAARLFQSGLIVFMQSGGADERNLFHGEFLPEASYIMICIEERKCEGYFIGTVAYFLTNWRKGIPKCEDNKKRLSLHSPLNRYALTICVTSYPASAIAFLKTSSAISLSAFT